jgi:hypothetical protein
MKVATMEEAFNAPGMDEATDTARLASCAELEPFFELSSELLGFGSGGYLRRVNPAFEATLGIRGRSCCHDHFSTSSIRKIAFRPAKCPNDAPGDVG